MISKIIKGAVAFGVVLFIGLIAYVVAIYNDLPNMITIEDYKPLLVSQVFDRNGEKVGEFFREKRILVSYEEMPDHLKKAFVAAEDDSFYDHQGINFIAIFRAFLANLQAGRKVQGGSTITQQVARSLLLTREKTYTRKIKEVILSYRMENNLKKEEILFLYLNQIFLGQGAYGVAAASDIYFRKPIKDITIPEAAILAGLPQAPSRYSPVSNPKAAKARQLYVLRRMAEENFISEEQAETAAREPIKIFGRENFEEVAPFFLETVRQLLVSKLGEEAVLDQGLKIYTGLDKKKQLAANEAIKRNLHELDKRQGFRGPLKNLEDPQEVADFLVKERNRIMDNTYPYRVLQPDGTIGERGPLNITGKDENGNPIPNVPEYIKMDEIIEGIVTKIDDKWGVAYVRFAESKGLIDLETMEWARKPNPEIVWESDKIKKPSDALKKGDVIKLRVVAKTFSSPRIGDILKKANSKTRPEDLPDFKEYADLRLEQIPIAESALLSIDQRNEDVLAMVGGYDFTKSKFNRSIQAIRQTGSSFKAFVYLAALDHGYDPSTAVIDAPVVYEELKKDEGQTTEPELNRWRPSNHSNKFMGEILFRNALKQSLNVPSVKIIEKLTVPLVATYAKRLGIFSPLNMDYTLALGSSGVTLYEMTRAFSEVGRLGQKTSPVLVKKIEDKEGNKIADKFTLDDRFEKEMTALNEEFEKMREDYLQRKNASLPDSSNRDVAQDPQAQENKKLEPMVFFSDPDQHIRKETAYVITSILQAAVDEAGGTGGKARALGRPVAGKTGSTNGYYDGWFVGYTADIATGVWSGFDNEKTLGRGEVGGEVALPAWVEYMKAAHEGLPATPFKVPDGIVFANIDNETGKLASARTRQVVRQAFIEGTEPGQTTDEANQQDVKDFYKEELAE